MAAPCKGAEGDTRMSNDLKIAMMRLGQAMRDEDHMLRMFGEACSKALANDPNKSILSVANEFQYYDRLEEVRNIKAESHVTIEREARKMVR